MSKVTDLLIDKLIDYCRGALLQFSFCRETSVLSVADSSYLFVSSDMLFDDEFNFLPDEDLGGCDGYVYQFGGRYYTQVGEETELKELKYIGVPDQKLPCPSFLGVHSGNELMNGVGVFSDWVRKAKFLGAEALGICEKNSLSGALSFQEECRASNIKPIIGASFDVVIGDDRFIHKFYAKNFEGWQNLLKFNTKVNVEGSYGLEEDFIKSNKGGLYCVADPKRLPYELVLDFVDFYQLDAPKFVSPAMDKDFIDNLEKFILSPFKPISIYDAYYLEPDERIVREMLWNTSKSFDLKIHEQHFKNRDSYVADIIRLFEDGNTSWVKLLKSAFKNEEELVGNCNFTYDTQTRHLPEHKLSAKNKGLFETKEKYFAHLLAKGLKERGISDDVKYLDRLGKEITTLKRGNVIDYFLDLYTIVTFAKDNDILVGIGRGSAGGSLVSYLLGIIQLNPLEFDLLFERFLNDGRMGEFKLRPAFDVATDEGVIELIEGTVVRIKREGREMIIMCEDLKEGDVLIKW